MEMREVRGDPVVVRKVERAWLQLLTGRGRQSGLSLDERDS